MNTKLRCLIFILLTGAILFSGCIQENKREISIYIDPLPYGVDSIYTNALREAISFWETRSDVTFKEVSSQGEADVRVGWIKEFGGATAGHAIHKDFIEIGMGDSNCQGKWRPYQYASVLQISMHELGHILGLADNYTNPDTVMYYSVVTSYETDIEETDVLARGTAKFYPVCTRRSSSEYTFEVTADAPLEIHVLPSRLEFRSLLDGERFSYNSLCGGGITSVYKETCPVSSDSVVALKASSTVRYTIKIKETPYHLTW